MRNFVRVTYILNLEYLSCLAENDIREKLQAGGKHKYAQQQD